VLVPNLRGLERALSCRPDEVNLVMSSSETHNRANLRMTREQSQAQLLAMIAEAGKAGVPVNVSLSTVFGCPFEGDVGEAEVMRWRRRLPMPARRASRCAIPRAWPIPTRWPRCARRSSAPCRRLA
jgi:hypothetical protein